VTVDLQSVHQFSRIYIEEDLIEDPRARELIERVASLGSEARVIPIGRYGEVFNRPRQNFGMQKHNPALILARERERFLYRGNERINSWKQNELYSMPWFATACITATTVSCRACINRPIR
jgi:spore photoproduct lyase